MKKVYKVLLCFVVLGTILVGCSVDDGSTETAKFSMSLVDAPGDYDAVLIDVQGIEAKVNGETIILGPIKAGVYDLLELTGGVSAMLVEGEIPAGELSQIRLILGDNNHLVVGGQEVALKTPSAQQSGLKLNVHQALEAGILYEFILDFNVDKSVVELGNGAGYILKPVIRATTVAESGAISGIVAPIGIEALVSANNGTDEIAAYTNPETGEFLLYGVPAGTYAITVVPSSESEFSPLILEDVVVEQGKATELGSITLE